MAYKGRPCPAQPVSSGFLIYWADHVSVGAPRSWGQKYAESGQVHGFQELESGP